MQGKQILHYTVGNKLGQGGMGEVYLAHDAKLDREVAIKFLPPNLQQSPEARTRLLREAQAASRLSHPNIVAIYAIEKADNQDFIVMERVPGRPLSDVIASNTLTLESALDLARQIGDALSVAHEIGVIHRDIKASNILVTERGQAKVLDFGLATFYGATQVTDAGTTMGTASYMSPEQTEGRPIDHRSDLFSFGVVLYEMIAGRRPFEGDTRNAVAYAICNQQQEPLARFKTGVPPMLEGIVAKALRKDPTERYQSAADLLADLRVASRESSQSQVQPGGFPAGVTPPTPPHPQYGGPVPPAAPQTPGYPQQPLTPSHPQQPAYGQPPPSPHTGYGTHTPSQPMPSYGQAPPPAKGNRSTVTIVGIIVVGLIAITAIITSRMGGGGPEPPTVAVDVKEPQTRAATAPQNDRMMVAVLPLENQGNADDQYFADGVTEEITARLASVRDLGVIARASVEAYKGSRKSAREIGRELGVDYVLVGTVRWQRGGDEVDRVRVTPQLVRVADGTNVWADVYDEPMTAVFRVQSTIAKTVAQKLDIALHEPEQAAMESAPTNNMDAYDAYLKGMRLKDNWNSKRDLRVAASLFEKATELDPDFLMAYARFSEVCADMVWFTHDQSEHRVEASRRAAERAMDIDENDTGARWAMGWYYYHARRDLENAMRYLEPVLEELPNSAAAYAAVAFVQRRQGRMEEALANLQRAMDLNPNDHTLVYSVGETMVFLGNWAEGRPYLDRSSELRPEFVIARMEKVTSYVLEGDILKARREAMELTATFGVEERGGMQAWVEYLLRDFDAYFAVSKKSKPTDNNSFYFPRSLSDAIVYRTLGDESAARVNFEAARDHLIAKLDENPNDFRFHGSIGIAYAGLGLRDEAIRHADRAMQLLPPAQDAMRAGQRRLELATTLILLGDHDEAIDQLEIIMSIPAHFSVYLLKKDPIFDPLRENPRFKALLGSS